MIFLQENNIKTEDDIILFEYACREALLIENEFDKDYLLNEMKMGEAIYFIFEGNNKTKKIKSKMAALKAAYKNPKGYWKRGLRSKEDYSKFRKKTIRQHDKKEEAIYKSKMAKLDKELKTSTNYSIPGYIMRGLDTKAEQREEKKKKYIRDKDPMGATKKISKSKRMRQTTAVGATAAVLAGIIYGGYKVYKNYLSKAAKACKGSGNKKVCMDKYKNKALKAQISSMQSKLSTCSKDKDPAKCKMKIQTKIENLKSKIK